MAERSAQQEAFDQFVVPELDVMMRVAMTLTRNSADAEDLVQDSLLRAYRAIERFDGRYPRAWLLTILRNTHLNRVRKKIPDLLRDGDDSAGLLDRNDASPSTEAQVVDVEFDTEVATALQGLDKRFKAVVELVDLDGLSYQEAANVLDIPIGTVMSRLHRARGKIRQSLADDQVAPRSRR